jgi:hypothetical protein
MNDETKTEVPAGIPAENPEASRRAWAAFFARIRRATEAAVERVAESLVILPEPEGRAK